MGIWNRIFGRSTRNDSRLLLPDGGEVPAASLNGQERVDEWSNILSGHGIAGVDPRTEARFTVERVQHAEARDLWVGDDIARKVIELLPKAMVREGYRIRLKTTEQTKQLADYLDTLGVNRHFARAKMYERAYGGAAIWPVINDGMGDLRSKLNEGAIPSIRKFEIFEPRELVPDRWYLDPNSDNYGMPETYRVVAINGGGGGLGLQTVIHESRMVIFPGIRVSRELPMHESYGWGDSVLTRVRSVLRDFHMTWSSVAVLFKDLSQGVFKMEGLTDMLAADRGDVVKRRLSLMDWSRSVLKWLAIDAQDSFERKSTPLTGVPDILIQFALRLSAAADTPATKLIGMAPAGMNATGESDSRNWYDTVAEEQEEDRPLLERLVRFGLLALDGPTGGKEPDTWRVNFNDLWAPSEKESSEIRLNNQKSDEIAIDCGMASPDELAHARWGGETYGNDLTGAIDFQAREKLAKASDETVKAAERAMETGEVVNPETALDSGQIREILDVVERVHADKIPREAGLAILQLSFRLSPERAADLLGPETFEPVKPALPVVTAGPTPPNGQSRGAAPAPNGPDEEREIAEA